MANANIYQSIFKGQEIDLRLSEVDDLRTAIQNIVADLSDIYDKQQVDAIAASIAAAVNSTSGVVAATRPTASASTLGKIYYIGPDGDGEYERYVTSYDGSSYSWIPLGSTAIDMSQYALTEDVEGIAEDVQETQKMFTGERYNYKSGGYIYTYARVVLNDNWNVTDYIPIAPGMTILWKFGTGTHDSSTPPCLCYYDRSHNYTTYNSSTGYTHDREITIPDSSEGGFIRASFANTYRGEENEYPLVINGVPWKRTKGVAAAVEQPDDKYWKPFPLGKLVQKAVNTSTGDLISNDTRVSTDCKIPVPFEGMRLRIRTPQNYPYDIDCVVYYGGAKGVLDSNFGVYAWQDHSEGTQVPPSAKSVRMSFRARKSWSSSSAWADITPEGINAMLEAGTLALEYYDDDPRTTKDRNVGMEVQAAAVRRVLNTENNADNAMNILPFFAHISDLHGDVRRFQNFMEYCDAMGVDAALNSGDSVMYKHVDNNSYLPYYAGKAKTPLLFCIGNHESYPTGQSYLFRDNIEPLVAQQGYLKAEDTPADHCYYYKDFDEKKIRVIALNYYEDGVYDGKLGQDQINWFISTLGATPEGYGVLVMLHSPEDHVDTDPLYDKFMQPSPKYGDSYQPNGFYVGNRPIMQIVDAFIGKTTLSTSYTDNGSTVTIEADFTSVAQGVEFIAYVCGHRHEDYVGYYQHSTHRQLCLCIVCGIALFGDSAYSAWTNQCDLPRGGKGTAQDAFNLYAVDRDGGTVRIVRVGADVTVRFAHRDMMEIPYRVNA